MVGKKQGHTKAYEVGQFLSKTAPFLVIDSSPAAREQALSQLLTLSASVSYTDAVVMAVADEYETQKIFGFDEAFANCGMRMSPDGQRERPRKPFYHSVAGLDDPAIICLLHLRHSV
jgi:predicted nucleic acid-binding protein